MCKKSAHFNKREQELIREDFNDEVGSSLMFWQGHIDEFLKYRRQAYDAHTWQTSLGSRNINADGSEDSDNNDSTGDDEPVEIRMSRVVEANNGSTRSSMSTSPAQPLTRPSSINKRRKSLQKNSAKSSVNG